MMTGRPLRSGSGSGFTVSTPPLALANRFIIWRDAWTARSLFLVLVAAIASCGGTSQPPGQLIGLDARTGAVKWRRSVSNPSTLVRWQNRVIATERNGLLALDAVSGRALWRVSTQLTSPPDSPSGVLLAGDVVVEGGSGAIIGFDAETGRRRWRHPLPGVGSVSLSSDDNGVYARLDRSWSLVALAPDDGRTRWATKISACAAAPGPCSFFALGGHDTVSIGDVVIATEANTQRVFGLDAHTGVTRWEQPISGTLNVVGGLVTLTASSAGIVVALDPATGMERWRSRGGDVFSSAVAGRTVLVGRGDGTLVALDGDSGSQRWQQRVERPRYSYTIAGGGDLVVVVTFDRVIGLDLGTGRRRWSRHLVGSKPNKTYSQPGELLHPMVIGSAVVITAQPPQRPED
jgi:outer membrane protein assembly factor BamB